MGGLIAVHYLLDHQDKFKGAIISAPSIAVGEGISQATITIGKILSAITPKLGLLALDASGVSRDLQVVKDYVNDPLVFHGKTPARLVAELVKALSRVHSELGKITLPFIVVHGCDDRLADPFGAQLLYDSASSKDKTLKLYEGLYHEVFNEPESEIVFKDIEDWLAVHLVASSETNIVQTESVSDSSAHS
jgi:alpha-beta hydrolase superfamily lysophospholipase